MIDSKKNQAFFSLNMTESVLSSQCNRLGSLIYIYIWQECINIFAKSKKSFGAMGQGDGPLTWGFCCLISWEVCSIRTWIDRMSLSDIFPKAFSSL